MCSRKLGCGCSGLSFESCKYGEDCCFPVFVAVFLILILASHL